MKTTFDMTTNIDNVNFQNGSMKDLNLQQVDELGHCCSAMWAVSVNSTKKVSYNC